MRLLVCSDIHFFAPGYSPRQIFSKEIIGNLNYLFSRKKNFANEYIDLFLQKIPALNVSHVVILGDFTCTSSKKEFILAQQFIEALKKKGLTVFMIPGNHDNYTRSAYKEQRFCCMLEDFKGKKAIAHKLNEDTWLLCLDTTLKTPPFHSWGSFDSQMEEALKTILNAIPKNHNIIIANHYPLVTKKSSYNALRGRERLQALLSQYPSVRFYLCGHEHKYENTMLGSLCTLNPGSLTLKKGAHFLVLDTIKGVEKYDLV